MRKRSRAAASSSFTSRASGAWRRAGSCPPDHNHGPDLDHMLWAGTHNHRGLGPAAQPGKRRLRHRCASPRLPWDNTTFRLGDDLSVRLPSGEHHVQQVGKEHRWLPVLAGRLPPARWQPDECAIHPGGRRWMAHSLGWSCGTNRSGGHEGSDMPASRCRGQEVGQVRVQAAAHRGQRQPASTSRRPPTLALSGPAHRRLARSVWAIRLPLLCAPI